MEALAPILARLRQRADEPLLPRAPFDPRLAARVDALSEPTTGADLECLRAVLHLWNDDLDRSHAISQDLSTPTGSLLHGIMHRREGDFGNACYWFRRAGAHEVYERLGAELQEGPHEVPPGVLQEGRVDPVALVRAVEADPEVAVLRVMQRREFEVLVQYCLEG